MITPTDELRSCTGSDVLYTNIGHRPDKSLTGNGAGIRYAKQYLSVCCSTTRHRRRTIHSENGYARSDVSRRQVAIAGNRKFTARVQPVRNGHTQTAIRPGHIRAGSHRPRLQFPLPTRQAPERLTAHYIGSGCAVCIINHRHQRHDLIQGITRRPWPGGRLRKRPGPLGPRRPGIQPVVEISHGKHRAGCYRRCSRSIKTPGIRSSDQQQPQPARPPAQPAQG